MKEGVPVTVGRCEPATIHIPDPHLSRVHARFTLIEGGRVVVEDLASRNGTWVGGERVGRAEVGMGDDVLVGHATARVLAQYSGELGPLSSRRGGAGPLSSRRSRAVMEVELSGRWFRVRPGEAVSLQGKRNLSVLVQLLAQQRASAPGAPLLSDALFDALWPDTRVDADVGANRVYVAISTLRKLGLRSVLIRHRGGYMIDPSVPVHWVEGEPEQG